MLISDLLKEANYLAVLLELSGFAFLELVLLEEYSFPLTVLNFDHFVYLYWSMIMISIHTNVAIDRLTRMMSAVGFVTIVFSFLSFLFARARE